MSNFKSLNLNPKIINTLEKKGYINPTTIQLKSIPDAINKKDILGIAQTGTGKTAAFSLPILHNLSQDKEYKRIRALILTPTRELASQIADNIKIYGENLKLRYVTIYGGVSIGRQIQIIRRKPDIVIATPGRLLDLLDRKALKLDNIQTLVLDEADRMLDMGFIDDIQKIISNTPSTRQTLFFSATMPNAISNLADSILSNPIKITVKHKSITVDKIDQKVCFVDKSNKLELLKTILKKEKIENMLIFSKTKYGADKLAKFLENEISTKISVMHSDKTQGARRKTLEEFRQNKTNILIATDIVARGIDIPTITHVINYDIPNDPENYVHRIGRTGRAGKNGIAISFCDKSEQKLLKSIERIIKIPNSHR